MELFSYRVLLLVTDAAPYMILMGQNLHSIYTNVIHVTYCVAHALHHFAEKVRESKIFISSGVNLFGF